MTDQPRETTPDDDTEGHSRRRGAAEAAERDDVEGHKKKSADAEASEGTTSRAAGDPPEDPDSPARGGNPTPMA